MKEMQGVVLTVTKEMADAWLLTNDRNRTLKKNKIMRLENDIKSGKFELTHQGIAIDENGVLIDGHHRLTSISRTGIPTKLFVVFNAPNSGKLDSGVSRSDRDALYMSGVIEKDSIEYKRYAYSVCGLIIYFSLGETAYKTCDAYNKHNVYMKFKDSIDKAVEITNRQKKGKGGSAAICYAMACAINANAPVDVVEKWHWIVTTGDFLVAGDMQATACGRQVLLFKNAIEGFPRATLNRQMEIVKKAESSIYYFEKKQPVTKIYGGLYYPQLTITLDEMRGN